MAKGKDTKHEYRRERGGVNRLLEKVESIPDNVFYGGASSDARKRKLYEEGIEGRATVLKAPPERNVSTVQENHGRFKARIEVPGREPYEVKVMQSYGYSDWKGLQKGMVVDCRVSPDDPDLVLLIAPEGDELKVLDSASILAQGLRAKARVIESKPLGQKAPNGVDEFHLISLELTSQSEHEEWRVAVGQRVPKGAEELIADGSTLEAAYIEVDEGDSVAIDWPASSGGRFS